MDNYISNVVTFKQNQNIFCGVFFYYIEIYIFLITVNFITDENRTSTHTNTQEMTITLRKKRC